MTEVAQTGEEIDAQVKSLAKAQIKVEGGLAKPDNVDALHRMAVMAVQSGLLPASIKSPQAALLIMQRGAELGFPGLTAFELIYPVNGRPRLTPAGAKAIALSSGLLSDFREILVGEGDAREAIVTVVRKGVATPIERRFSMLDAKRAGLAGKDNWKSYPDRMLLARARGFAFQDGFPDLCGGMQVRDKADLDPGETIALADPVVVARPKTGVDPVFAKLGVPLAPKPEPVDAVIVSEPFQSHAEADAAIAAEEK